jgi:hypothetical protein
MYFKRLFLPHLPTTLGPQAANRILIPADSEQAVIQSICGLHPPSRSQPILSAVADRFCRMFHADTRETFEIRVAVET